METKKKITKELSKKRLVILAIITVIVISTSGVLYYFHQADKIREEKSHEFIAISKLKINQIVEWRKELERDINVISQSKLFTDLIAGWLANPSNVSFKNEIIYRLKLVRDNFNYDDIIITSKKGEILLALSTKEKSDNHIPLNLVKAVVESRENKFSDLYLCPFHDKIYDDIVSPMISGDNVIATLIFRVDPNNYLYPLIQEWPIESKTAETLIFRQDGDSVLFLNELRHQHNTALKLKISLNETKVPAVQAVLGKRGLFEGLDYRNKEVLSFISDIPGAPWLLIAKIDKSEVFSELKFNAVIITFLSVLLVGIAFSVLLYIYSTQQRNTFKELFEKEKELRESQEQFRIILYSIGDAVITTDKYGLVQQVNSVAERLTGWTESEAKGKSLEEIFRIINLETRETVTNPVQKVLGAGKIVGLANHTVLISKNGEEFMIADSGAPIMNSDGDITGVVLVFRDQTIEYNYQKKITESELKFRNLFNSVSIPLCYVSAQGVILSMNNRFLSDIGYSLDDMPTINEWWLLAYPDEKYRKWVIDSWNSAVESAITSGKDIESDVYNVTCKNGLVKNIIIAGITIGEDVLATFIDVTEQKEAERIIIREKVFSDSVINAMPGIFYLFDQNGKFVKWNNALADLSGFSYNEIGQKSPLDFIVPHDHEKIQKAIQTAFKDGEVYVEADFLASGRKNIPFYFTGVRIMLNNEPLLLGVGVDISRRKKAQQELIESERRLSRAIEDSPFPIMIHAEGGEVIQISNSWLEFTGYQSAEIANIEEWAQKVYGLETEKVKEVINLLYKQETGTNEGEFEINCKNGKKRIWDISSSPIGRLADGRKLVITMGNDITARKEAEKELELTLTNLQKTNIELESFNKMAVGRELRMVELKRKINSLSKLLGKEEPYELSFTEDNGASGKETT